MTASYRPPPTRPLEMTPEAWACLLRLSDAKRHAVLERASLIHESGIPWAEADERALAEEAGVAMQRKLVGT